ncbi:MAG: LEA type 2 family protein [Blastocatellia bacterium]|nr:LEA type 2 family protein [Blastocatellia bacterium]
MMRAFLLVGVSFLWGWGSAPVSAQTEEPPRRPRPLAGLRTIFRPQAPAKSEPKAEKNKSETPEPELHVKSIQLEKIHLTTADLAVTVELKNPFSDLTVSNLTYRIKLNDVPSGNGKYKPQIKLPANGAALLVFPVTVDLTVLPEVGVQGVLDGIELKYQVDTEFDVSVFIFKRHIKKKLTGDVPLTAVMPKITLPRITLPKIEFP